ncbi:hypothetical protein EUGRSUZ_H01900, partial [Eucalyptus grandis]
MLSSSSSSSSSEVKWRFDVFINFRGEDVRHGFVDDLHKCLLHRGINAYIDSEDLRRGDKISPALMKAIEESRIAVLVFSENYASSSWCLNELVKVMECRRLKEEPVLPVFYKVEPGEIRGLRGRYGDELARHEKLGQDPERVDKWREALIEAANLAGWHYTDEKSQDETEFIKKIVKEISHIVERAPLSVAKYPVGVGSRVENVMSLLSMGAGDVRMIGIWGAGGVGKTTIAKAVYNSIADQFDGCSFLANVRENSGRPDGLVHLQKKMLSEILWKEDVAISNVDQGANLIPNRLCCRKILLVLDDVDHGDQLNALARECGWFGKGSRIIITTRDKHVLPSRAKDRVYEVDLLDQSEAFKLLSSHAFQGNQMKDISRDLIDNILGYAKGLPLAIVVLGAFLFDRSRVLWQSTLEKLAESPTKDIYSVLKISFDALEENEKDIFLDITCFFKGWGRDYVTRVLDGCGLKTLTGIQILIDRSLVTIEYGMVEMHDLIQQMGQDIVKHESHESLDDPGKRSRLWCYDDVFEVLSEDTRTQAVKGIGLRLPREEVLHINPSAFTRMRKLKLLILSSARISGGLVRLPNNLRWLEWHGCHLSTLEFSAGRKKLVCFDVRGSQIEKFGGNLKVCHKCFSQWFSFRCIQIEFIKSCSALLFNLRCFRNLKFLNFSHCEFLICVPDFSEELYLDNCKNLEHAHNSVAYLRKLWLLNLEGCSNLQRFIDILNKNNSLREIYLNGTSIEELPTSIENLISLKKMYLFDCKELAILPSSIYRLQNLEVLQLHGCSKLIEFAKEEMDLSEPHTKTGFPKLLELNLACCLLSKEGFLENLSSFLCLQYLNLEGNNFTNLPTFEKRYDLKVLNASNCQQLREVPEIPRKLRRLEAYNCKSLQKFHRQINRQVILPGGEMPKWLLPNEDGYISFVASKDMYKKILGVTFCVVFRVEGTKKNWTFEVMGVVDGKVTKHMRFVRSFNSDHVWLEYMESKKVWTVDPFSPNDSSHFHFSIRTLGYCYSGTIRMTDELIVKKCGFRLICKPLENDAEVLLEDDQLLDPALLYE